MTRSILLGLLISFNVWAVDSTTSAELNMSGRWAGEITGLVNARMGVPLPCGPLITTLSFIQNENKLVGQGVFYDPSHIVPTACYTGMGQITGHINENSIVFEISFPELHSPMIFSGAFSDDQHSITGTGEAKHNNNINYPWSMSYVGFALGDTNGDGAVYITDVITIINSVLNDTGIVKGSDCNEDGVMDITDVVCAINVVLNQ